MVDATGLVRADTFYARWGGGRGAVPDGLVGLLGLGPLAGQFLVQPSLFQAALPHIQLQGSTALVVPLQLRVHLLWRGTHVRNQNAW